MAEELIKKHNKIARFMSHESEYIYKKNMVIKNKEGKNEYFMVRKTILETPFIYQSKTNSILIEIEKILNKVDPEGIYHPRLLDSFIGGTVHKQLSAVVYEDYSDVYPNYEIHNRDPSIKVEMHESGGYMDNYTHYAFIKIYEGINIPYTIIPFSRELINENMVIIGGEKITFGNPLSIEDLVDFVEDYLQLIFRVAEYDARNDFINDLFDYDLEVSGYRKASRFMVLQNRNERTLSSTYQEMFPFVMKDKKHNPKLMLSWWASGAAGYMDYTLLNIELRAGFRENYDDVEEALAPDFMMILEYGTHYLTEKGEEAIKQFKRYLIKRFSDLYRSIKYMLMFRRTLSNTIIDSEEYAGGISSDKTYFPYKHEYEGFPTRCIPLFELIRKDIKNFQKTHTYIFSVSDIMTVKNKLDSSFNYNDQNVWNRITGMDERKFLDIEVEKTQKKRKTYVEEEKMEEDYY